MSITPACNLVVMICLTLLILGVYVGLAVIFSLAFVYHSGQKATGVFLGLEVLMIGILVAFICYYLYIVYQKFQIGMERLHAVETGQYILGFIFGIANLGYGQWHLDEHWQEDFSGLPDPKAAVLATALLIMLSFFGPISLIYFATQAKEFQELGTTNASRYTPQLARHHDRRVSAKVVAVQHGSPPELWAQKKRTKTPWQATDVEAWAASLPPMTPTFDPRSRPLRPPPPILTSGRQWYVVPGVVA